MAAKSLGMLLEVKGLSPCPRPAELEGGTGGEVEVLPSSHFHKPLGIWIHTTAGEPLC